MTLDADSITVLGNYIGIALDGGVAANTGAGVFVEAYSGDTIGGTTAVARNVISGNGGDGIDLNGLATVEGNFIGTDPTGQAAVANQGNGVTVFSGGNIIGGSASGAGNIIAFNRQSGVLVNTGGGMRDSEQCHLQQRFSGHRSPKWWQYGYTGPAAQLRCGVARLYDRFCSGSGWRPSNRPARFPVRFYGNSDLHDPGVRQFGRRVPGPGPAFLG